MRKATVAFLSSKISPRSFDWSSATPCDEANSSHQESGQACTDDGTGHSNRHFANYPLPVIHASDADFRWMGIERITPHADQIRSIVCSGVRMETHPKIRRTRIVSAVHEPKIADGPCCGWLVNVVETEVERARWQVAVLREYQRSRLMRVRWSYLS
jgi:hypothetical protein